MKNYSLVSIGELLNFPHSVKLFKEIRGIEKEEEKEYDGKLKWIFFS